MKVSHLSFSVRPKESTFPFLVIKQNTKRLQYPHFQLHKSQQYTTPPLFFI
ncbi:hypothetical protein ACS0TY_008480 [Phlomoides rotata]